MFVLGTHNSQGKWFDKKNPELLLESGEATGKKKFFFSFFPPHANLFLVKACHQEDIVVFLFLLSKSFKEINKHVVGRGTL